MTAVKVRELTKRFGDHVVLDSVSLDFEARHIYGLVGRNGSGKSVLMKCIAGLVLPTKGTVEVFGKRVGRDVDFAPDTGIAIEQPGLLLGKSAFANLRILSALTAKPSAPEITHLLEAVGLNPKEKKAAGKYSMGMKQRLSIAMALLGDPKLLLLDEPMSNLDHAGADEMRALCKALADAGKTIIIATHVTDDIAQLCRGTYRFEAGRAAYAENAAGAMRPALLG
ncbi:multidrug ABC transporter ATP-binding protein [Clostridia bacterium]|nr:multidrug ABC transporter ATP-binding protein [Clostridia bacterium]